MEKKPYIPPELEVFTYVVEKGFAESVHADPTDLIFDVSDSLENVREGEEYSLYGDDNWY